MKENSNTNESKEAGRNDYRDKIRIAIITGIIGLIASLIAWKIESANTNAPGAPARQTDTTAQQKRNPDPPVVPPIHPALHMLVIPVLDGETNRPVAGVRFSLQNGQQGVSDPGGNIKIDLDKFASKQEKADFLITLSKDGYKTSSKHVSANSTDQQLILVKDERNSN